jgi:acyl carrier protein
LRIDYRAPSCCSEPAVIAITVNPPPPRISAGQCRALCYIASLSRSGSWKLDLERRAILTEVGGIIRSELDDQPLEITEHTVIDGIDGWDSVAQVRIIVAIESRFSVRFEPDEYMDFQNVGELVDCLSKKLSEIGHERTLRPRAALRT